MFYVIVILLTTYLMETGGLRFSLAVLPAKLFFVFFLFVVEYVGFVPSSDHLGIF